MPGPMQSSAGKYDAFAIGVSLEYIDTCSKSHTQCILITVEHERMFFTPHSGVNRPLRANSHLMRWAKGIDKAILPQVLLD